MRNCSYQNLVMTSLADWSLGSVMVMQHPHDGGEYINVEKMQHRKKWQTWHEMLGVFFCVVWFVCMYMLQKS